MHTAPAIIRIEDLPNNIEAEQQLIGAVLVDNLVLAQVADMVSAEDFSTACHIEMWKVICQQLENDQSANPVTLKAALSFETVGELTATKYMLACAANPATQMVCRDYARLIADLAARRKLITEMLETLKLAQSSSPEFTTSSLIDKLGSQIFNIPVPRDDGADDSNETVIAELEQRIVDRRDGKAPAVPVTKLTDLDRVLTGLHPGRLIVGAGRPGMGKTQFGVAIARKVARQGYGVLSFSAEINKDERLARLIAAEAALSNFPVTYADIMNGDVDESRFSTFQRYARSAAELPILIDDRGGPSIGQIEMVARKAKADFERQGKRLALIDIDYLGLLRAGDRYRGNRVMEIGEITSAAKNLAKRLQTTVLLWSQLNRAVETRENKRPNLSDLRDSGSIEQDADQVLFLYRPAYYDAKASETASADELDQHEQRKNDLEVIIDKNRLGPTRTVTLYCDIGRTDIACRSERNRP